ncbi:macrophage migration inhibitory factor (MIF) domain-containing protein [Sarocladium implicatum]|nr:macrophage migration inhibitory factor (MIF) domain-containing protein [Sarocladium implicatum]
MTDQVETPRPSTPSSSSPDTPRRPLPSLPPSSLPLSVRRPTKNSRPSPHGANVAKKTNLEPVMEGDGRLMRDVHSPPPGDVRRLGRKASGPELSKQRSQYFEEAFRSRHASDARDDAISVSSIILAEIKTNVFVADEFKFITDLADHLSARYSLPVSHVAISLQHGACLHFGGTFDPAYTIAVHAPPKLIQPATNRRNIALLQTHLEGAVRVGPARGFVRFVPVHEDFSGWKGDTIAGQKDREKERERHRDKGDDQKENQDEDGSPTRKKKAIRSLSLKKPKATDMEAHSSERKPSEALASMTAGDVENGAKGDGDMGDVPARSLRKKKSFMHSLFVRTSREEGAR